MTSPNEDVGVARPSLSLGVRIRRHWVDGALRVVLSDDPRRQMVVGEREYRVLCAMDGSRDPQGIAIASGIAIEHVEPFVAELRRLGLLRNDAPAPSSEASPARDVPVRTLSGVGFQCDGGGACCATADTVLFTPLEAARARALAPDVSSAGEDEVLGFSPSRGTDRRLLAVAMQDGACAYWNAAGRCRIHGHHPAGCRTHPVRYVDVGTEIRVALRMVCACEARASEQVLTEASRGSQLPASLWVERLPGTVRADGELKSAQAGLAWLDERRALSASVDDPVAWCAELASGLGSAPDDASLSARVHARVRAHAWRSPRDHLRRALGWLAEACDRPASPVVDLTAERRFLQSAFFVGDPLLVGDLGSALRSYAERMALARRFGAEARQSGWARHPLVVVNAVARATGLW